MVRMYLCLIPSLIGIAPNLWLLLAEVWALLETTHVVPPGILPEVADLQAALITTKKKIVWLSRCPPRSFHFRPRVHPHEFTILAQVGGSQPESFTSALLSKLVRGIAAVICGYSHDLYVLLVRVDSQQVLSLGPAHLVGCKPVLGLPKIRHFTITNHIDTVNGAHRHPKGPQPQEKYASLHPFPFNR